MLNRWFHSLYIKIFLSFLATCILFFVGLAVFWNYTFSDLFFKEKKGLLEARANEVLMILNTYQEGSISSRELHFGIRLIARSFNGELWIVNSKGSIQFSSVSEREGAIIPKSMDYNFSQALKSSSGFSIGHLNGQDLNKQEAKQPDNVLTYYATVQLNGQQVVLFLHTPVNDIIEVIASMRWNIGVPLLFSLLAVAVILYTLSRKLTGPLQQMNQAALDLAEGDFSTRVSISSTDEIGQLAKSFNFMVEKLEQWEDTRQEFLTNISHELRSPLTTLRGMIIGMKDKVIPEQKLPHYLKICDHEVQRLQRLINDLLDLARIQNNTDVFRISKLDVIKKSKEIIDLLAPVFEEKGLKLEVWVPEQQYPVPMVELDPDRYAQIVNNLLYNAMQFTPAGNSISVTLSVYNQQFVLHIEDTGIGMSEEEVKRIWERFYKVDPSRGMQSDGTGLGLTIVKHLVSGLHGTISVQSELGVGTEFIVHFPLAAE